MIEKWWDSLSYGARGFVGETAGVAVIVFLGTVGVALGIKFGKLIGAW